MNYRDQFTPHHIAMLHDWLTDAGGLFVRLELPIAGEAALPTRSVR
jgi:hypothetical protein